MKSSSSSSSSDYDNYVSFVESKSVNFKVSSNSKTTNPKGFSLPKDELNNIYTKFNQNDLRTNINSPVTNASGVNTSFNLEKNKSLNSSLNVSDWLDSKVFISLWNNLNHRLKEVEKGLTNSTVQLSASKKVSAKVRIALNQQAEKMHGLDTSLDNAKDALEKKVKDFEGEVINARNSLLGVIALFASFFSFISIAVNIFSKDMSITLAISILLMLWSCLVSFLYMFMAGISKGGAFFTSASFVKHGMFMVVLFLFSFVIPKILVPMFNF